MVERLIELRYRLQFFKFRLPAGPHDVVVSMTSYPARIQHAWIALESLFRQVDNKFELVLVLCRSQFPGEKLPLMICLQIKKGLRVLWVDEDNRSFDHLWPAYKAFPQKAVISVDDDKHFSPSLVGTLRSYSKEHPGSVIGARGWQMKSVGGDVEFGAGWVRADPTTSSDELFMPPGNGSLYPPGSLPQQTGDVALMKEICPVADDVWYWVMAKLHGSHSICVGMPPHRPVLRQADTAALSHGAPGPGDFASTIDYFGLRGSLVENLPG